MTHAALVAWAGFAIGLLFGIAGQRSGFCLMSGFRGWWVTGDGRKIRAFAVALAVAMVATQAVAAADLVPLQRTLYLQPTFSWPLFVLGGALFGYGMVMANGCGARALVLLGSGNLRSFVVLVCLGIAAYVVLTGLLAPARVWMGTLTTVTVGVVPPTVPGLLTALGFDATAARWLPTLLMAGILCAFAWSDPAFRASPRDVAGGVVIGLLVPAGWMATGHLGADDFDPVPVASLTFIAPIGDAIQYLMLSTGTAIGFGVTVVAGVLAGSSVAALASGSYRLEGFPTPQRMLRSMSGGALMGAGGALALGCSIGQGLTGLSTLALPSFVAAAGIALGSAAALKGPLRLPDL